MTSQPQEAHHPTGIRSRRISPLAAAGWLLIAVAATGLVTYALLTVPARLSAASGPPEAFRAAATQQAMALAQGTTEPGTGGAGVSGGSPVEAESASAIATATPLSGPTPTLRVAIPSATETPTPAPTSEGASFVLPDWIEPDYWLSIPVLGLEAPVVGYDLRVHDVDGVPVERLPVPNTFAVGWDATSAEPGFAGNTIMAGHNNLYGAVFGGLTDLQVGDEIAIWSDLGVFSYHVSQTMLLEEKDQPLDVRLQNAQWLADTTDDRLTLITCWPRETYTHRLIIVATR